MSRVKYRYAGQKKATSATVTVATEEAKFSYDAVTYQPTVHFYNESIGEISSEWDFGDGSPTSAVRSPMHTYNVTLPESFTVRLTINASVFVEVEITVEDPNPPPLQLSGQILTAEQGATMTATQGAEMLV